jgi:glycosyltransferase involved in cell wall biosynthesis
MAWRFCGFCRHLKRICRAVQPDLVHANNLTTALAATRVSRAPAIWHVRDMPVRRRLVRAVRSRVARVIAISRAVAANVEAVAPGGAPVVTIYNGWNHRDVHVTRRRSQVRGHWEMAPDTPLVGCMAQFVPWKRHDLVLQALPLILPQVPQARLVLLGEDLFGEHTEYLASLHALAAELGIEDRIIWGGCVPDPANALAALDVVAHAADREPFGRVVLEAIALGIPVVAVDAAGPAEIIEDGRSGLLVPPDDPAALAEGVTRVLGDAELAQSLSDGARIRAAAFTASVAAEEVVALYREVMAEREAN